MEVFFAFLSLLCLVGMEDTENKKGFTLGFIAAIAGTVAVHFWG